MLKDERRMQRRAERDSRSKGSNGGSNEGSSGGSSGETTEVLEILAVPEREPLPGEKPQETLCVPPASSPEVPLN